MRTLLGLVFIGLSLSTWAADSCEDQFGIVESSFSPYVIGDQRKAFFNLMRDLPEGRYNLRSSISAGKKLATMFVKYERNFPFGDSRHTLALKINVFEGSKEKSEGDDKAIAYFINSSGAVDSWSVHELEDVKGYDLDCTLPYGYGYSQISIHMFESIGFSTVIIKGETYSIAGFAPIQRFHK